MKNTQEYCRCIDHRQTKTESLVEILLEELRNTEQPALYWVARRPKKRWHLGLSDWQPLLLSSAPQHEEILWLAPGIPCQADPQFVEHCERLLGDYAALFQGQTPLEDCPKWESYRKLILSHIREQEQQSNPQLLEGLPLARPLRELGYEHRGLEKGLESLPPLLQAAREGRLSKKERERIDLDFFHLLEHHVERERDAISPAEVFLKGVYRRDFTCYNSSHREDVPT